MTPQTQERPVRWEDQQRWWEEYERENPTAEKLRAHLSFMVPLRIAELHRAHAHCWCEPEAICVLLRTSRHTVDWYIGTVRAAIRDQHSRGSRSLGTGKETMAQLKAHAQECLHRAEGHAATDQGAGGRGQATDEDTQPYEAPTALDTYWRKRAAQQERERRYG